MRLIEATFPQDRSKNVEEAVLASEPVFWTMDRSKEGPCSLRAFYTQNRAQSLLDSLESIFDGCAEWRVVVVPVVATLPQPEDNPETDRSVKRHDDKALREEIYDSVEEGAALSLDFFVLIVASTIVAAIGMNSDSVAAVIGAMVIAPLLGPFLAVTLGVALGDRKLILRAGRNAAIGTAAAVGAGMVLGLLIQVDLGSRELMIRTVVGVDAIALALAAGGAAALSLVSGASTALVGVMVAAALLPPLAALGLFLGSGEASYGARAALLFAVNVVCIMLAAQAVYAFKGVRPRDWLENKAAKSGAVLHFAVLAVFLAAAVIVIVLNPFGALPDVGD